MTNIFMQEAIKEAYMGINADHGGPFGAIIVSDNKIIGRGHNMVLLNNDSTCHGEMMAIRDACKNTGSFSLKGAELYTTAEPCPMCLGAILWANISTIYYGCSISDTCKIGFSDEEFYKKLSLNTKNLNISQIDLQECLKLFEDYNKLQRKRY